MKQTIGIFSASKTPDNIEEIKKELLEIANKININNYNIVYGGGNIGLMGIIPIQFCKNGGDVTGFDIQMFVTNDANGEIIKYGKQVICKTFDERQEQIIINSDIILVLPGGLGTVYELLQVLVYNDLKLWQNNKKRKVILFNHDDYFKHVMDFIHHGIDKKLIKESTLDNLVLCDNPDQVIQALVR